MRKKMTKYLLLLLMFLTLTTTVTVSASPEPLPGDSTTVVDKTKEFSLDAYYSHMDTVDGIRGRFDIGNWLNSFANLFFDFNKIIYQTLAEGMTMFSEANLLQHYTHHFNRYSNSVYNTLYTSFGFTIIVIMALYCFYLYITKSPQQAVKQFISFATVVVLAMVWNARSTQIIQDFNSLTSDLENTLASNVSQAQGSSATSSELLAKNMLFEVAIEEPYLLMNYGTAERGEVIGKFGATGISDLLYSGDLTDKKQEAIDSAFEKQVEDNIFMTADKAGWKFVVASLTTVTTPLLGAPIFLTTFASFVVDVMILLITALMGITMFLSVLPRFRMAFLQAFTTLIGLFFIRVILSIVMMMVMSVVEVIRELIPTGGIASYLLQILAIAVTFYALWKNRNKILSFVTGGALTSANVNLPKNPFKKKKGRGGGTNKRSEQADDQGSESRNTQSEEDGQPFGKKNSPYDIFADRQAFNQHEQDKSTQVAVDDYFETVDQQMPSEEIEVDDLAIDAEAVQEEINELVVGDVQFTNDEVESVDNIEIENAEKENVDQAEINELEATDIQSTNESDSIDTIEIESAETQTVDQAEINELEATDVQSTNESDSIDTIEIESAETQTVDQAEINELEATDIQSTNESDSIDMIEIQSAETETVEQAEVNELEATDIQPSIIETSDIAEAGLDAIVESDISIEHFDQQSNEFFNHLENEALLQANNVYEAELEATHIITPIESDTIDYSDLSCIDEVASTENFNLSTGEKQALDQLLEETRGER